MKVFWSWQNDSDPKTNRQFIRNVLAKAIDDAGEALGLEDAERPKLDHDTKDTPGMTEITSTILRKISESAVFVADLTPVGEADNGKALPNPNVLIELGWALSELGPDRIIAILNTHEAKPDDLPFDIRHRRALTYELAPDADKPERRKVRAKLTSDLAGAITANLRQYSEERAAAAEFKSIPAKEDDPSIWASHTGTLEYIDTMERNGSVSSPNGPRAFLRVIPSGWKDGIPQVAQIQDSKQGEEVWPSSEGASNSGDYGPCEEGFVRLWFTGDNESRNVSMWFDETGEFGSSTAPQYQNGNRANPCFGSTPSCEAGDGIYAAP